VAPTWGVNNRIVSLRVPSGPSPSRHIEHRVSGADANPYLVAAVVLSGVLHGIETQADPGPPIVRNGHEQSPATLPSDWRAAIDAAERSAFLRTALGDFFLDNYIAVKRQEWDKFNARVSEADYEWYLETV
jgi:glutamine synthetase